MIAPFEETLLTATNKNCELTFTSTDGRSQISVPRIWVLDPVPSTSFYLSSPVPLFLEAAFGTLASA